LYERLSRWGARQVRKGGTEPARGVGRATLKSGTSASLPWRRLLSAGREETPDRSTIRRMSPLPGGKRLALSAVALVIAGITTLAQGPAGPSKEPMLRLEIGAHIGAIGTISVDRAGKFIVTGGDKTVRLWDAASARLLRVFRPPIGASLEGNVGAALSPDG